jgi:sigma-B regulation protein RsbU (phosphoserine phosphatase)
VTAFYGIFNPPSRQLRYAVAGHNPPRLWRCATQDSLKLDAVGGLPMGVVKDVHYPEAAIQLNPGDRIVFYTDGITEAQHPDGKQFGTAALDAILQRNCQESPQTIVDQIVEAVRNHTSNAQPTDDRTLVAARVS